MYALEKHLLGLDKVAIHAFYLRLCLFVSFVGLLLLVCLYHWTGVVENSSHQKIIPTRSSTN